MTSTIKEIMDKSHSELLAKIRSSPRYKPVTDQEFDEWVANNHEAVLRREAEAYQPDYDRIGILESDLSLIWSDIKKGYSDGDKAVGVVQEAFERGHGMIFMYGNYGQAKTLIGKILTVQAFKAGKRCAYANLAGVLDNVRLSFDEQELKTTELLRRMNWWMDRDVLFLDELDKVNNTPWASERIFQLLDARYMRAIREEALTVIVSNQSEGTLDGYIKSRLQDRRLGPILHLNGPDARQIMPNGWKQ